MDNHTPEQRRKNMQAIKGKDTDIELLLRKLLWEKGLRYRKNVKSVYGHPDIAFIGKKVAVFCDSEFWHGYDWETRKKTLGNNRDYWIAKIERNIARDREVNEYLTSHGWIVIRFWGNEIKKKPSECVETIKKEIEGRNSENIKGGLLMTKTKGDNSDGFANEKEIIKYLNGKKYEKLNRNMKDFIDFTFSEAGDLTNSTIKASKPDGKMIKPDIVIEINNVKKYVSVKKGSGNSVHQEKLSAFEDFLKKQKIPPKTIKYLKEFHYGDGTTDGTGKVEDRVRATAWISSNSSKAKDINEAFNSSPFLELLIDRVLFEGNIPSAPSADVVFHGNTETALWASREEIIEYLKKQKITSSIIHFSNLTYQAWNRNLNNNPDTADRRHIIQVKWPSLTEDLNNIKRSR